MGLIDRIKRRLPILHTPMSGAEGGRPTSATPPPGRAGASAARPAAPVSDEPESPRGDAPVQAWIEAQVKGHPVVLFMKGEPSAPLCGFSANAAGILSSYGSFHHVDVIADPDVREGVKEYTNWPTLPQVFVGGEFVGGSDILRELHDNGELRSAIEKARAG